MELREFVKGDLWSKSWLYRVQIRMSIVTLEIRWSRWRRDALAAGPYRPLGIDSRQLTAMCSDHRPRIDPMSARPGRVRLHPSGEVSTSAFCWLEDVAQARRPIRSVAHLEGASKVDVRAVLALLELEHLGLVRSAGRQ